MPSLSKLQIPALVVLLLGVITLGVTGWELYSATQPDYTHEVYTVDSPSSDIAVYNYSELSPQGQEVFRDTIDNDGFLVTHSESRTFDTLGYAGDASTAGDGIYWVRYDGQWWEVLASSYSGIGTSFTVVLSILFGGFSLAVIATGVHGLRNERSRVAPSILAGVGTTILFLVGSTLRLFSTTFTAYMILLGLSMFVSPLVAYFVLGRTGPWANLDGPDDSSRSSSNGSL